MDRPSRASHLVSQRDRERALIGLNCHSALPQWVHDPEKSRLRNLLFQIHLMVGAVGSAYIVLMSITGSIVVWQVQVYNVVPIEWLVKAHDNLLAGSSGRIVNGIGGACLVALCLTGAVIWWPGIKNWRRSLTVQ